jgi:hypothetical protein
LLDPDFDDDYPYSDTRAIEAHGYDPRTTPVDTLMAGPVQMHFDFADDMGAFD